MTTIVLKTEKVSFAFLKCFVYRRQHRHTDPQKQGRPVLVLEGHCAAEFSCNPSLTHPNKRIKVLLGVLETSRQVCSNSIVLKNILVSKSCFLKTVLCKHTFSGFLCH